MGGSILTPADRRTVDYLLLHCGGLKSGDRLLVLCVGAARPLAEAVATAAANHPVEVHLLEILDAGRHGVEPPAEAAAAMARASLIMCLCQHSLAHTRARIDAGRAGARFLSLPLYNWALLSDPALGADFRGQAPVVRRIADAFTAGRSVRVTSAAGTDL